MSKSFREIYIEETMIEELPLITEGEFTHLHYFYERENIFLKCNSVLQWQNIRGHQSYFNSSCINSLVKSTTSINVVSNTNIKPFSTSAWESSLYTTSKDEKSKGTLSPGATANEPSEIATGETPNTPSYQTITTSNTYRWTAENDPSDLFTNATRGTPRFPSYPNITTSNPYRVLLVVNYTMMGILIALLALVLALIRVTTCRRGLKRVNESDPFYPPIFVNPTYRASIHHTLEDIEMNNV